MNSSKYVSDRWSKLISLDKIRLLKILEIFQYTTVFTLITILASILWKKGYNIINQKHEKYEKKHKKEKENKKNGSDAGEPEERSKSLLKTIIMLIIETFMIILTVFYIRKIGLLCPSIASIIYPKFRGLTTVEYSEHVAVFIILIELLPEYKRKLDEINEELKN